MDCPNGYAEEQVIQHKDQVLKLAGLTNGRFYLCVNPNASGPTKANIFVPNVNAMLPLEKGILGGHRIPGHSYPDGLANEPVQSMISTVDFGIEPTQAGFWNKVNYMIKTDTAADAMRLLKEFNKK